jgi:hypothetical protein
MLGTTDLRIYAFLQNLKGASAHFRKSVETQIRFPTKP